MISWSSGFFEKRRLMVDQIEKQTQNQRILSPSDYLNMVHAIHFVHAASSNEKSEILSSLKQQIEEAKNENDKIGKMIT